MSALSEKYYSGSDFFSTQIVEPYLQNLKNKNYERFEDVENQILDQLVERQAYSDILSFLKAGIVLGFKALTILLLGDHVLKEFLVSNYKDTIHLEYLKDPQNFVDTIVRSGIEMSDFVMIKKLFPIDDEKTCDFFRDILLSALNHGNVKILEFILDEYLDDSFISIIAESIANNQDREASEKVMKCIQRMPGLFQRVSISIIGIYFVSMRRQ